MSVKDYKDEGQTRRFFKINAKEAKLFENVKNGEAREDVARKNVEGKFVRIETVQKEYEGKPTEYVNLVLQDGEETYIIGTSRSALWQSLVNSLAGEVSKRKLGNITLSVYTKKVDGGKEYPRLSLHNNGETMEWKYGIEEQKTMVEVIENSKGEYKGRDASTYIDALRGHFDEINTNEQEDKIFWEEEGGSAELDQAIEEKKHIKKSKSFGPEDIK